MSRTRKLADIYIHDGKHRNFEWYWDPSNAVPGLDAFELLDPDTQNDFAARLEMWGDLPQGTHPSKTQINVESNDPLILAVKCGKHRFPAFHAEGTNTWIITAPYLKQGRTRDKRGDSAISRTIKECQDYETRTKQNVYYQRDKTKNP